MKRCLHLDNTYRAWTIDIAKTQKNPLQINGVWLIIYT